MVNCLQVSKKHVGENIKFELPVPALSPSRLFLCALFFFNLNMFPNKPMFLCVMRQCKSFENTVGKIEIAHGEQLLFFPQCSTHF